MISTVVGASGGAASSKSVLNPKGAYRVLLQTARDLELVDSTINNSNSDSNRNNDIDNELNDSKVRRVCTDDASNMSDISPDRSPDYGSFSIKFSLPSGAYATVFLRELLMNNDVM